MPASITSTRACAELAEDAFERYNAEFRAITRRAPQRFDERDWQGSQRDAVERIELYGRNVEATVASLRKRLGDDATDRSLWANIKEEYARVIDTLPDAEFRKTFFNSLTRTFFKTEGVAPELEFFALDLDPLGRIAEYDLLATFRNRGSARLLFEEVLAAFRSKSPWRNFVRSAQHVADEVAHRAAELGGGDLEVVEMIRPPFYQMTRAYLVGRVTGRDWHIPLVIVLKNTEQGLLVDAVMTTDMDISVLFSYTRSYFHVDLERVGKAVVFLRKLMPHKPVSELFTVIGRAKQGKTERYRELFRHLQTATDKFVLAPGERGLVMVVFTLPSFDVVFKLIRDRFPVQKNMVREDVRSKYEFVFKHDRAGRLVDAQEFKRLRFPRRLFDAALLDELLVETRASVHEDGDDLIIDHCYIERRLSPLNLYLREADAHDANLAALEYGQSIRDLAYTNIFAGDLLLKNFGVTRSKRVIFYDYDELCLVTDCRFRELPQASSDEDEMRSESWFYVADNDVFPETFLNFLSFSDEQKQVFLSAHGELLTADWWRDIQRRHRANEIVEVLPYAEHRVRVASS